MIAPNPKGARHDQRGRHPDVFLHELFLRRTCTRDHNAAGLMIMKGQAVFDLMSQSRAAGSVPTDYRQPALRRRPYRGGCSWEGMDGPRRFENGRSEPRDLVGISPAGLELGQVSPRSARDNL